MIQGWGGSVSGITTPYRCCTFVQTENKQRKMKSGRSRVQRPQLQLEPVVSMSGAEVSGTAPETAATPAVPRPAEASADKDDRGSGVKP